MVWDGFQPKIRVSCGLFGGHEPISAQSSGTPATFGENHGAEIWVGKPGWQFGKPLAIWWQTRPEGCSMMQDDAGIGHFHNFPQFNKSTSPTLTFDRCGFHAKLAVWTISEWRFVCLLVFWSNMGAAWGLQTISHNSQLQLDSRQEHGVNKDQRAPIKNDQNWNHLKSETLDRQQHRNVAVYLVEIAHTCEKWVAQGREKTLKSSPLLHVEQTLGDFMLNILNLEAQTTRNTWWFLVKNP